MPVETSGRPPSAQPNVHLMSRNSSAEHCRQAVPRRYPARKRTQNNRFLTDFIKKLQHPEDHVVQILSRHPEQGVKQDIDIHPSRIFFQGETQATLETAAHPTRTWKVRPGTSYPLELNALDTQPCPPDLVTKANVNVAQTASSQPL